ncbi:MAG: GNAT family N-acetyltransferase [Bdellovibrionales bacterium]
MSLTMREAVETDVETIVSLLEEMQNELQALAFDRAAFMDSVRDSLKENVTWFLFADETGKIFGTCHLQSLHNYWRRERRFYLGGFYIAPSHRGKGYFKEINKRLEDWAKAHNGVEIYAHIHQDNEKSLKTFESVGLIDIKYQLCVHYWGEAEILPHKDND